MTWRPNIPVALAAAIALLLYGAAVVLQLWSETTVDDFIRSIQ